MHTSPHWPRSAARLAAFVSAAALGFLLGACGGGGGGGEAVVSTPAAASATADGPVPAVSAALSVNPARRVGDLTWNVAAGSASLLLDDLTEGTPFAATAGTGDPRALELAFLRYLVPEALLPMAHLEVVGAEALAVGVDAAGPFLGLTVWNGQPLVNGGVRAEASIDYPYAEGRTVRYAWSFALPADFADDRGANRWWLLADWHDQPDPRLGQTWAGYPSRSPPVALGYGVGPDGSDLIALTYGAPSPVTVGLAGFSRGQWHRLRADIKWSRGPDGRVDIYLDGDTTPVLSARGPNMHNAYQHYLKLGGYRQPDIPGRARVFVRDLAISTLD